MPTYVDPNKCDGCMSLERTVCQYICPNDLMKLDTTISKAFNQEPDACWECYACVKMCPQSAIEVRGYADMMPMGASVTPMRGTDSIMWAVKFRDGTLKRFRFATRTKPEGSIQPFDGFQDARIEEIKKPGLVGESEYLGISELPVPRN